MNVPEGTGSERDREPDEGIVLPSWIDAAISRARQAEPASPEPVFHEPEPEEPTALPHEAVDPMSEEPVAEHEQSEEYEPTEGYESVEEYHRAPAAGSP